MVNAGNLLFVGADAVGIGVCVIIGFGVVLLKLPDSGNGDGFPGGIVKILIGGACGGFADSLFPKELPFAVH